MYPQQGLRGNLPYQRIDCRWGKTPGGSGQVPRLWFCVPACPENALHLETRPKPSKVYKTNDALFNSIYAESAVALVGRKLGLSK